MTWSATAVLAGVQLLQGGPVTPQAFSEAQYLVLPADKRTPPPFEMVSFLRGPLSQMGGVQTHSWQLDVHAQVNSQAPPLLQIRCRTSGNPLAGTSERLDFFQYQLRIPSEHEAFDYRNAHTGRALLPAWHDFVRHFFPQPLRGTNREGGFPKTCLYLGHVLSLHQVRQGKAWADWSDATVLVLDDELLIGTGRVVRDTDGRRLPQKPERQEYHFTPFTEEDYRAMIQAGMNTFALVPGVEKFLRSQPVFYRRGDRGDSPLHYPADFYRSNFRGSLMYEDEPACIMVGEPLVQTRLKHFTDAAALLHQRVQARYWRSAYSLEETLRNRGVSFGAMRLGQTDYAVWETRYETAFYQLEAGFAGFVHEGRYDLRHFYGSDSSFDEWVRASTGLERTHTAEEMLRIYFAFLRGAARHFQKFWGVSIYGQADPDLAPLAMRLAYDMGARYLWYWTSGYDHHLPWGEQLDLTRRIQAHARQKPRPSIRGPRPTLDKVLVIPYGTFLVLESPSGRKNDWDLWWVRELDPAGHNPASQRYRDLMRHAFVEIHQALSAQEDFDITVDDGRPLSGYNQVVRIRVGEEAP